MDPITKEIPTAKEILDKIEKYLLSALRDEKINTLLS